MCCKCCIRDCRERFSKTGNWDVRNMQVLQLSYSALVSTEPWDFGMSVFSASDRNTVYTCKLQDRVRSGGMLQCRSYTGGEKKDGLWVFLVPFVFLSLTKNCQEWALWEAGSGTLEGPSWRCYFWALPQSTRKRNCRCHCKWQMWGLWVQ